MQKTKTVFLTALILTGMFGLAKNSLAADHYIRAGAAGANNGSSWTNAWTDLPAAFVRGDTYYVAGGSYGGHAFSTAVLDTAYITVKKANEIDNGDEIDWDASYAATQAVFTEGFNITTDYWRFDGVTGVGSDPSSYGFKIQIDSCTDSVAGIAVPAIGYSVTPNNVHAKHFAVIMPGSAYNYGQISFRALGLSNITLSDSYLNNGHVNVGVWNCASGCIIENNYIDTNWSSSENHGGQMVPGNAQNLIIRNNVFRNSSVYIVGGHVTACINAPEIEGGGHGSGCTFTRTVLTDNTKNWIPNRYAGYTLSRNHNGSSAYSSWTIIENTANTITVDASPYDLNVGNAAVHGALDDGDIYWITMSGIISNISNGSFDDVSHVWSKDVTGNTYQLGVTHAGQTVYYRIGSISGNTINVLPPTLVADGRANNDTYLIKQCLAPSDNLQFYNNTIIGNGNPAQHSGIITADSAYTDVLTNLKVYNNTFYNYGVASVGWINPGTLSDASQKAIGRNNLFYDCISPFSGIGRSAGSVEKSNNAYLKCTGNVPAAGSETGMQRDDAALSPFIDDLAEDFRLTAGNLAVDNGATLDPSFQLDHAGISRPQGSAWDIGAYEYAEGGDTTPPSSPSGLTVR